MAPCGAVVVASVAGVERDGELAAAVGGECRARGLCCRQSYCGVYDYMSEMSEIHKTGHKFKQFGAKDAPRHAEILPRGQFFVLFGHRAATVFLVSFGVFGRK